MATRIEYRPNTHFDEEFGREIQPEMIAIANIVVDTAKSLAPVGATGNYRDGIEVVVAPDGVHVAATDYKSHWIEWGTRDPRRPAKAVIRRAVKGEGLKLNEAKGKG